MNTNNDEVYEGIEEQESPGLEMIEEQELEVTDQFETTGDFDLSFSNVGNDMGIARTPFTDF